MLLVPPIPKPYLNARTPALWLWPLAVRRVRPVFRLRLGFRLLRRNDPPLAIRRLYNIRPCGESFPRNASAAIDRRVLPIHTVRAGGKGMARVGWLSDGLRWWWWGVHIAGRSAVLRGESGREEGLMGVGVRV